MGFYSVVKENMPEPQKFVPMNQEDVSKCHKNKSLSTTTIKTIRIVCNDPYATDSSDDEGALEMERKRFVREICVPVHTSFRVSNSPETKSSARENNDGEKNFKKKRVLPTKESKPTVSSGKYRGVRQRKWGKWAAEIRDPVQQKRVWLGTYNSAEEASMVYETKRMEFEALANSIVAYSTKNSNDADNKTPCSVVDCKHSENQKQNLDVSEEYSLSAVSPTSPSSALDLYLLTSAPVNNTNSENEKADDVSVGSNVIELKHSMPGLMDEELMSLAQIDRELDLDLDSFAISDNVFGMPVDDADFGFEDFPTCGFNDGDQPCELPDFDFDFDFDAYGESFSWMDEAPPLKNGTPLNVGCP